MKFFLGNSRRIYKSIKYLGQVVYLRTLYYLQRLFVVE
jgi:hypothetical protein